MALVAVLGLAMVLDSGAVGWLDRVAAAIGGKEGVLGVRTLVLDGAGRNLFFGQTHTPYSKTFFTVTKYRRSYDFGARRWLVDQTRESRYLTPVPPALRVRIGVDGEVGYNVIGEGPMSRAAAGVAADRAAELLLHPIGFLQAALAPNARVTERSTARGVRIELETGALRYAMDVDRQTGLPWRISRTLDHPMLGDVALEMLWSDWRPAGDLRLPYRVVQRESRWILSDYRLTGIWVNVDPGALAATDSVRAVVLDTIPPPADVAVRAIVPGVWSLTIGEYHSIAIEQARRVVLVEAPENDARALAIIARARELVPGKPLGPLVNTHHHFDHAGGIRAAISEGLEIVTDEGNADFYRNFVYPGRHQTRPDALAGHPRALELRAVHGRLTLADSDRPIHLYHVTGSPHSGSMLVAHLPAQQILIQADLDNPPGPGVPAFTPALIETVRRLGLAVQTVVGIHGEPVPWTASGSPSGSPSGFPGGRGPVS